MISLLVSSCCASCLLCYLLLPLFLLPVLLVHQLIKECGLHFLCSIVLQLHFSSSLVVSYQLPLTLHVPFVTHNPPALQMEVVEILHAREHGKLLE